MTFLYILHLVLVGLIGFHCQITTIHNVPVRTGGSISIPCLYERSYRNHAKYLCRGFWSLTCFEIIKTNETKMARGRFSISDDTNQRIFTVTIKDLIDEDEYFWCAVKIKHKLDVKQKFQLSVSSGTPSLYVHKQEIKALKRGNVTVVCHCEDPKITQWCRLGSTCVKTQTGLIDGTTVKIDRSAPDVFNVIMSDLRTESSGWYWCACNNLQMPVHITVHELPTITTTPTTPTLLISKTKRDVELHTAQTTHTTITEADGKHLQDEQKSSTKVIIIITTLLSLFFILLAACFGWRIRKKSKQD
ncbi:polymeric immunoglobulin receptor-like isoform X2 [Melanotaenia boesemani]|uniref:polymeric immunoglobulin receptor-like isoform X2 n=1 Tax=Melanotaenia boesemani TaxID=1250792 RepID=UPI001C05261F|nr:polymeric immunoglobulin receptor-like isoform X2 [Melanotaenia boesemani]